MQTSRMRWIKTVVRGLCASLTALLLAVPGGYGVMTAAAQAPGPTNLLVNGDFEYWDWNVGSWPFQDGIPEVQVCPGWRAYYVDTPPEGVTAPEHWKRPEFRDVKRVEAEIRVRSGERAQKYFTFGGQHIAGLYQQVAGITPGTPLRFAAYMQAWGCMAGEQGWNVCPTGDRSNNPSPMHLRVGIDPTGGTNPWAPSVVWSPEINAYDQWTLFQVDAVAQAGTVTVFTHSYADWFDYVFRIHNDIYIDDASLISLDELPAPTPVPPTATSVAPAPTTAPTTGPTQPTATPQATAIPQITATPQATATPRVTPTPYPDTAVVHVVQDGDTLNAIASAYQVPATQIQALNTITDPNALWVGQILVIAVSTPTPSPSPSPTASPAPSLTPTAPPSATPTPTVAPLSTPGATVPPSVTPRTGDPAGASDAGGTPRLLLPLLVLLVVMGVGGALIFKKK